MKIYLYIGVIFAIVSQILAVKEDLFPLGMIDIILIVLLWPNFLFMILILAYEEIKFEKEWNSRISKLKEELYEEAKINKPILESKLQTYKKELELKKDTLDPSDITFENLKINNIKRELSEVNRILTSYKRDENKKRGR